MAGNATTQALRAECEAQLAILKPQIRGLEDMLKVTINPETQAVLQEILTKNQSRVMRLDAMIGELNNLEADGYPDLPMVEVPAKVAADLAEQMADFQAALSRLTNELPATSLGVNLGQPEPKP